MNKKIFITIALVFLLASIHFTIAIAQTQEQFKPDIDIDALKEIKTLNNFLYPRIFLPAFKEPGDSLSIIIYDEDGSVNEVSVFVVKGSDRWELKILNLIIKNHKVVIYVEIPDLYDGLYDLNVIVDGVSYYEPHSLAIKAEWSYPIKILKYSDTHYDNRTSGIHLRQNFLSIIWQANFINPDFMIIVGDILNTATEANYHSLYDDIANYLKVPIIGVPGNHDHHYKKDLFTYYFAPSNISINIGPLHLIILDTGPGSLGGDITNDQIKWLKRDLEVNKYAQVTILATHHPISLLNENEKSNKTGIENLLAKSNIDLIIHGHMHYLMIEADKYPLRITDPNAYEGGSPYSGFRIINVTAPHEIWWKYNNTEDPYPIFDLKVYEYQYENGSNKGYYLKVINNMAVDVVGAINARISKAGELHAEGIDISDLKINEFNDFVEVKGKLLVKSGSTRIVKLWVEKDDAPPKIVRLRINTVIKTRVTRFIDVELWDEVFGIQSVRILYSLDNETWKEAKVFRLTPTRFYSWIIHSQDESLFIKLVAKDPVGHTLELEKEFTFEAEKPETPVEEMAGKVLTINYQIIIPPIIAVVIATIIIFLFKKR